MLGHPAEGGDPPEVALKVREATVLALLVQAPKDHAAVASSAGQARVVVVIEAEHVVLMAVESGHALLLYCVPDFYFPVVTGGERLKRTFRWPKFHGLRQGGSS